MRYLSLPVNVLKSSCSVVLSGCHKLNRGKSYRFFPVRLRLRISGTDRKIHISARCLPRVSSFKLSKSKLNKCNEDATIVHNVGSLLPVMNLLVVLGKFHANDRSKVPGEGDLIVLHVKVTNKQLVPSGVWPVLAIVDRVHWIKTRDKKALNPKLGKLNCNVLFKPFKIFLYYV